ncbi:coiled-coil domain-containing protein 74B-like isoform X5 [Dromaius novaehollandiae]|uniref:coiled-coil domain-containing protein 74B-like isoform X5 n=1 Tax=Dromaius novaehollandiae TaxID=8790 RepID=UPI00311E870E
MAAAAAERGLAFLRQQHAEMLAELHEEIEYLKRENRDNTASTSTSAKTSSRHCSACNSTASQHSLKQRLRKKKSRKHEQSAEECVVQVAPGKSELRSQCMEKLTEEVPPRTTQIPAASSSSFLVNALPSWGLKPPTLGECQVVIRQLWSINQMQAQQIVYLKSCLENIHKTKRISGDYLITSQIGNPEVTRLPKLSHKDAPRKCLMAAPVPITEKTILPPLKQTLGNSFVERQKRTQAIQRSRLHRTAL